MREWCWPYCHDWGKWRREDWTDMRTQQGLVLPLEYNDWESVQVRQCKRCGLEQTRPL